MNSFYSRCPVVERTKEAFVEYVVVGGERRRMEHVKEILWIQETRAQVRFMHGGRELKTGSTHTDFHGYMTSFHALEAEAEKTAAHFNITRWSSLELELFVTLMKTPAIETAEDAEHNRTKPENHKPRYSQLPDTWRKEVPNPDWDPSMGELYRFFHPNLDAVILDKAVVWSSQKTQEENHLLTGSLRAKWQIRAAS